MSVTLKSWARCSPRIDYSPTGDILLADVIVINTCSIRDKAEQKVYSLLGTLKKLKEKKPSLIISVAGCVAQQEGKRLQVKMPQVDIVIGPQQIYNLPELIAKAAQRRKPQLAVDLSPDFEIPRYSPPPLPKHPIRVQKTVLHPPLKSLSPSCRAATTSAPIAWCHTPGAGKQADLLRILLLKYQI